eukprot:scaffold158378_cov27-Tisochrysis_lutea.AAC.4
MRRLVIRHFAVILQCADVPCAGAYFQRLRRYFGDPRLCGLSQYYCADCARSALASIGSFACSLQLSLYLVEMEMERTDVAHLLVNACAMRLRLAACGIRPKSQKA